jgi:hypothetical protein
MPFNLLLDMTLKFEIFARASTVLWSVTRLFIGTVLVSTRMLKGS